MKRLRLLPMIIMLIAGLITCIIAVVKKFDNTYALTALFVVLLTFYVVGLIARTVIRKVCFSLKTENESEANEESVITEDTTQQQGEKI
ncbi:hypothetical protein C8E03_102300 [Lachnotalea glycerini]|uniref:Uncharacterized protein n=1 Tax=Lachnotalea glycerini TaxID=1763509 RepID=A0A255I2G3_9FIRM|nr:hypothetical protein [Lachnotalea glycerini]PXV93532.1 hypothetical protein C8E03_102300 [Lachnotalea glycerini]RDY32493.1 hypothetical protein CG710_003425 [Lachnotalea glycerini]